MKKLITILTVMIVLVGAVFATDEVPGDATGATQIDITAKIEVVAPRFSLATNDATDLDEDVEAGIVHGKTAGNITVQETASFQQTKATALGAGTAQTISFVIKQTQNSRIKTGYNLTVTATDLKKDGTSTTPHEFFTCTTKNPGVTGVGVITDGEQQPTTLVTFAAQSEGSNVLVATYAGGAVDVSTKLTNNVIGSFDVSWNGDPLAAAGTYKASIILEVAAN